MQSSADVFAVTNATLLTMQTGDPNADLLESATLLVRGGRIVTISGVEDPVIPEGAQVFNAQGGKLNIQPTRGHTCSSLPMFSVRNSWIY